MGEEKKKSSSKGFAIFLIIAIIAIITVCYFLLSDVFEKKEDTDTSTSSSNSKVTVETEKEVGETKEVAVESEYALTDNNLSKFDLSFLKLENEEENKIYSPLSIKYAFKMLEEATTGDAHNQIASIVKAYNLTKYESNENMALANAFFVRDTYKNNIKENYVNALKTKYNAEVILNDFSDAEKINLWVKEHTLNLIPELFNDSDVKILNFALVNALGIDMEWNHKFLEHYYEDDENITSYVSYSHERIPDETWAFGWYADECLYGNKFYNSQTVSSMEVYSSLNNYDIVSDLGEDKIYEIVYNDFKDWALGTGKYENAFWNGQNDDSFNDDYSEENIKKVFDNWFYNTEYPELSYINSINSNYAETSYSTDFLVYVDDDIKVFAKDLKEYDGTTLQYIGIMPQKIDLDEYIEHVKNTEIIDLIGNLKELKRENFKDGYLTYIHGYIPKFTFEYELDLQSDLEKLGITDVFEQGKANLTKMTNDKEVFIGTAKHKANIEFTQDGIKAAATTVAGGLGAGEWYDYFFEMPTEDIDITFNKPYMFLIRDKETGETWFVGSVYEPLDYQEDNSMGYSVPLAYNYYN